MYLEFALQVEKAVVSYRCKDVSDLFYLFLSCGEDGEGVVGMYINEDCRRKKDIFFAPSRPSKIYPSHIQYTPSFSSD